MSRLNPRLRAGLMWFGVATGIGVLLFTYEYLDDVARGVPGAAVVPLVEELTGAWAMLLLVPAIVWLQRGFPLDRPGWVLRLPIHLVAGIAVAAAHTTLLWASRSMLFPLLELGRYDYGQMPVRYAMELPKQLIVYAIVIVVVIMLDRRRAARDRERSIEQLQTQLVRARLDALRMQLRPHFLFNALNTVSSVMYEDVRKADAMLSSLSQLLRRTMDDSGAQEIPLREELEILELYLDVMRARFDDRLDVRTGIVPEAVEALVPSLILQPIVENAIEHGAPARAGDPLRVDVSASVTGGRLRLSVRDWGPGSEGSSSDPARGGVGLSNTIQRLQNMYGEDHRFETGDAQEGGFSVLVEIPYREGTAVSAIESPLRATAGGPV